VPREVQHSADGESQQGLTDGAIDVDDYVALFSFMALAHETKNASQSKGVIAVQVREEDLCDPLWRYF
jgi:hypothetical protein